MSVKKGIVDPWRVVEPLKKPKPKVYEQPTRKINLDEVDWDADIRVPQFYIFSGEHASVQVRSTRIETPNDALRDLVLCLFEAHDKDPKSGLFVDARLGFSLEDKYQGVSGETAAALRTSADYQPRVCLYFVNQTYDHGMLRLVKLLNALQRGQGAPGSALALKRWGVTPMMR